VGHRRWTELPLAGWESRTSESDRVSDGGWGLGLWLPIDFHMVEDFEDDSNPIVNTDYRFGVAPKFQYALGAKRRLGLRLLFGHESSHLGDEFSMAGKREFPNTFERINVSWEFLDVGLLYEDFNCLVWSVRLGITVSCDSTYYSVDSRSATESAVGPVTESSNWLDPYVGFDLEWEDPMGNWGVYLSGEARWRSVYDYHKADPAVGENRRLSVNVVSGLRKTGKGNALGRASFFVRFYCGVNPHGQFRNQRDYMQFRIGLRRIR